MTSAALRRYLAVLGVLVLFSLSPLAGLGGLVVAALIVAPLGIILGLAGLLEKGSGFDHQLAILFWTFAALMALTALWFALRAARHHDHANHDLGRAATASAATAVAAPVVICLCYRALGL